ncbi:MAG TPA: heme ABC exporter ATP-binding protein CcmA [Sphingopyxis sp.]|nr:heme ABC exporter ATP-binding protein CcmA [Sphingopyxis sp.]
MTMLLTLDNIACVRGDRLLFKNLSLRLDRGDALWIQGPNGTGKSSLIRLAAGLLRPFSGTVTRRERCALLDESLALDAERPLRAALNIWGRIDGVDGTATVRAMQAMALTNLSDIPVAMLSTGQRKRAAMARVIASGAPIWLLDEPANGLDSNAITLLVAAIAAHRQNGGAVLIASHFALGLESLRSLDLKDFS